MPTLKNLKHETFVLESIKCGVYSKAYATAFPDANPRSVEAGVTKLLKREEIQNRFRELNAAIVDGVVVTQQKVIDLLWRIATGNANEVISHRRVNCRHCFGVGFEYQWIDEREYAKACALAMDAHVEGTPLELPSNAGGFGFKRTERPHPKCPQCSGEGYGEIFVSDTRDLQGDAKLLYAGVKETRNGIEVQLRDQDGALDKIARILGLYNDKLPGAANNNPLPPGFGVFAEGMTATDVAKAYNKLMG